MQVGRGPRPRMDHLSADDDRRSSAARSQMNDHDGADGRWSGRSDEDAAAREVAGYPGRSSLFDLEADRNVRSAATRCSLLLPGCQGVSSGSHHNRETVEPTPPTSDGQALARTSSGKPGQSSRRRPSAKLCCLQRRAANRECKSLGASNRSHRHRVLV